MALTTGMTRNLRGTAGWPNAGAARAGGRTVTRIWPLTIAVSLHPAHWVSSTAFDGESSSQMRTAKSGVVAGGGAGATGTVIGGEPGPGFGIEVSHPGREMSGFVRVLGPHALFAAASE